MASLAEWSQATLPAPEGLSIHCDAFMGRRRDGSPLAFDHPLFSAAIFVCWVGLSRRYLKTGCGRTMIWHARNDAYVQ
jgi:hypothetical protein